MATDPRNLLKAYQERLRELRTTAGPAGPLLAPLQLHAEVLEAALTRQAEIEQVFSGALQPINAMVELARNAPEALRTQAKAFDAAAVSFKQAADVMNLQADVIERTAATLGGPAAALKAMREDAGPQPG